MKILLVTHYYSTHRGGIETVAHRLAALLAASADISVQWIASDCDAPPANLPAGLRCTPARSWNGIERRTGLPCPLWSPGALRRLWRAVKDCDALHLHDVLYMGNLAAFVFAKLRRKPVLVTQHVGAIPSPSRAMTALLAALNRILVRAVLEAADKVVFISTAVQAYYASFCSFERPPAYVPNGVDTALYEFANGERAARAREQQGRDADRPVCLFVGRFVESKGVPLVVELARRFPRIEWILAGNGPLAPEDAALPNITVVRGRSGGEIAVLYQMADLLVLPSRREGFPLVVQEAMACGTPALVSWQAAEGCPAALPYLFTADLPADGSVAIWETWIRQIFEDRAALRRRREEVSRAARDLWSWPRAAADYRRALEEIVGRPCVRIASS